jgi:hypothetical protein
MGLVGNKNHIEEIFLDNLNRMALESNDVNEYLIVFKQIPIKIKVFIKENLELIIDNYEYIQKLDILIITVNQYDKNSLKTINKHVVEEFSKTFLFQGLSVLVGLDIEQLFNHSPSKSLKISRFKLEKTTKDLNLIYSFEVFNKRRDINEIYNILLNDFILRFQYSNPDLFEKAKEYGKWLIS